MPDAVAGQAVLSYTEPGGRRVSCQLTEVTEARQRAGWTLRERTLRLAAGPGARTPANRSPLLQRLVPAGVPPGFWEPYDLLDNEIRIGLHLARVFGDGAYPGELSRLVGYDIDADEPFVLLLPYRGEPVEQAAGRLKLEQERSFEVGLFRTVRMLEAAGVVHGRIGPCTIRWDPIAASVQLVDFGRAALVNEPRLGGGESPWSAPEQVAGTGAAAPGDDMWSAGLLTYHVATGHPVLAAEPPDMSVRGSSLQPLLDGVFAATPADRPSAVRVLGRLRVADPWPVNGGPVDRRFAEGGRRFDELLADKFPAAWAPGANANPAARRRPPKRRWPTWRLSVVVAIVVALLGALIMVEVA